MEATEKIEEKKQKTLKPWMLIALAIVIGIGAVIFTSGSSSNDAVSAADDYLAKIQAGQCSEVYMDASDELKRLGDEEEWNEACKRIGEDLQGEADQLDSYIAPSSDAEQEAEVTYVVDGSNGEKYGVGISMIDRDGTWQISDFDSDKLTDEDIQELEAN